MNLPVHNRKFLYSRVSKFSPVKLTAFKNSGIASLSRNHTVLYENTFMMSILCTLRFSKGAPKQDQFDCNFVLAD
jgi:hypothetical protein